MTDVFLFPFSDLTNEDLALAFSSSTDFSFNFDNDLKQLLTNILTADIVNSSEFKYYTPTQFDNLANNNRSSLQLSIFHVNVRSLNANFNKLIAYIQCLNFDFDVLV